MIYAISCSSYPNGVVLIDSNGKPSCDMIDWENYSFANEQKMISLYADESDLIQITGNRFMPGSAASMLFWYKTNMPDIYDQSIVFLFPKDYLTYRFSGQPITDPTDASYSQLLDIDTITWSEDLLARFAIPRSFCPEIVKCGTPLGHITAEAAMKTGLSPDTLVIQGASNKGAIELTSMITGDGDGVFTVNLSSQLQIHTSSAKIDPTGCAKLICSCIPEEYQLICNCRTSCTALNWFGSTVF
jgi:xylulokinase